MPKTYLSYSWKPDSLLIADTIDNDWQAVGLTLIRDKRDVEYKKSLREFMQSMSKGDYVLVIISKGYLESENCMYEALELFRHPDFKDKILPIIAPDSDIYSIEGQVHYIKYWDDKITEANEQIKKIGNLTHIKNIFEKLDHYQRIRESINDFIAVLNDMRAASWPEIRNQNYEEIFKYIGYEKDMALIIKECLRVSNIDDEETKEIEIEALEAKYKDNFYVLMTKADAAHKIGKYKKNIAVLRHIVSSYPNEWAPYYNLALHLAKHFNDYEGARKSYEHSLRIYPDNPSTLNNLAILLKNHSQDYTTAKNYLLRAIAVAPNFTMSYSNIAVLFKQRFKDYSNAKKYYEIAVRLTPEDPELYHNFAILLDEGFQDYEGALNNFEKADALPPSSEVHQTRFAEFLHYRLMDYIGAREHYERALTINPNYARALCHLADLMMLKEDYKKAREYYELALNIDPEISENNQARHNLIIVLRYKLSDYEAVRKHYEYLINKYPNDTNLRNDFGGLLTDHIPDYKEAETQYKTGLEINPDSAVLHYNYGILLHMRLNRYLAARGEYERALELNPVHLGTRNNLNILLKEHFKDEDKE